MNRHLATWALVLVSMGSALASPVGAGTREETPPGDAKLLSEPSFLRWQRALERFDTKAADLSRHSAVPICGSDDALRPLLFQLHEERRALLESLQERAWGSRPPGSSAWPWGSGGPPARTLAAVESLDTAVVIDDGRIVFTNLNGALEVDPFEASQAFFQAFDDEYDFLILFTNFPSQLGGGQYLSYHLAVANQVEGLGYRHVRPSDVFDDGPSFTGNPTSGRLQSVIHLNNVQRYPDDAQTTYWQDYTAPALMGHEIAHRWGARLRLCPLAGGLTDLLGRSAVHWSFFFDTHGSVLEGNDWELVDPYRISRKPTQSFGPLDLYLMGMLDPTEVGYLVLLNQPVHCSPSVDSRGFEWRPTSRPEEGVSCTNEAATFDLSCITDINGARLPAYPDTQRDFRVATLLVTRPEAPAQQSELEKIAMLRQGLADFFHTQTLGRGTLDFEVRPIPARLHFLHHPRGDVEEPTLATRITTGIALEQRSLPTTLDDVQVTLFYRVDGGDFQEVAMERQSSEEWGGEIPPQSLDSVIEYYLRATTVLSEHVALLPPSAPSSTFSFSIAPDTAPPSVSHLPIPRHGRNTEPALFRAVVLDDHEVGEVQLEYSVDGGPVRRQRMFPVGVTDVYETRLAPPGQVGDVVQYRIVASDRARVPHVSSSPAAGTYPLQITRAQILDAEREDPLWSHRSLLLDGPDEWHREHISHNGNWSWRLGPDNISTNPRVGQMSLEQDAVLESPVVLLKEGWELRFYHRYYLRMDPNDGGGTGIDGAIVQMQFADRPQDVQNDRWWLMEPQAGYPMHLEGSAVFNPLRGYPCWSGSYDAWRFDRFTSAYNGGLDNQRVRFRFRVAAGIPLGISAGGAGWYVDDIEIDPGIAVPVTLQDLHAAFQDGGVVVTWRAMQLEEGDRFRLSRARETLEGPGLFETLIDLAAHPSQEEYTYVDEFATPGDSYLYRVTLVRGAEARSLEVRIETVPLRFALHRARPNPFNPSTQIDFDLPEPAPTTLTLYDVTGKRVRQLLSSPFAAGTHHTTWDGTDDAGRPAASGVYVCLLQSGGQRATQRLLLLR